MEVEMKTTILKTAVQVRRKFSIYLIQILTEIFQLFKGMDAYDPNETPQTVPPHNPIDINAGTRINVNDVNKNDLEHSPEAPGDPDIADNSHETKISAGSSSTSREWRTKRLIITYFLPIVVAWFGGSISGAVADLLWFFFKKFLSHQRREIFFWFVN